MWSFILGLIPGAFKTIDGITTAIANERLAQISAKTDQERIASQERVSALQARRDALVIAEANPWTVRIQALMALGVASIILKFLTWDKVVGSLAGCAGEAGKHMAGCETFRTDPLDVNQWWVVTAVVGFYFLADSIKSFRR